MILCLILLRVLKFALGGKHVLYRLFYYVQFCVGELNSSDIDIYRALLSLSWESSWRSRVPFRLCWRRRRETRTVRCHWARSPSTSAPSGSSRWLSSTPPSLPTDIPGCSWWSANLRRSPEAPTSLWWRRLSRQSAAARQACLEQLRKKTQQIN